METHHRIIIDNASRMAAVAADSVDLVVTSPPYPMIQMWDDVFCSADPAIGKSLNTGDGDLASRQMHKVLDRIWKEVRRVTRPGGLVCINIGDATRTIGGRFRLFDNHSRIIATFLGLGFDQLPMIIWRKTTNAPNKFMGSGMYPPGAYVTLEHEYILIFRLGAMREFCSAEQKQNRRDSAYFWEERNTWFSDVWFDLVGTRQATNSHKGRERSAAFPFELAYRLINMFSVKGDMVLDPFLGTGTTMLAAMAGARNSVGYEIDLTLKPVMLDKIAGLSDLADQTLAGRLARHANFVKTRLDLGKEIKYKTKVHQLPVITRQECDLRFERVDQVRVAGDDDIIVSYLDLEAFPGIDAGTAMPRPEKKGAKADKKPGQQLELFN